MDPAPTASDAARAEAYAAARDELLGVLGSVLVTDVEHVGSTSVPGLRAKPIIDLLAGVSSLDSVAATHSALEGLGYGFRPHRREALLFVRVDVDTGLDTHHLHLTTPGSALWVERLTFRDALRSDPDLAARYAAWKQAHATGDPRHAYDTTKTPFVTEVLAARGVALEPDEVRLAR